MEFEDEFETHPRRGRREDRRPSARPSSSSSRLQGQRSNALPGLNDLTIHHAPTPSSAAKTLGPFRAEPVSAGFRATHVPGAQPAGRQALAGLGFCVVKGRTRSDPTAPRARPGINCCIVNEPPAIRVASATIRHDHGLPEPLRLGTRQAGRVVGGRAVTGSREGAPADIRARRLVNTRAERAVAQSASGRRRVVVTGMARSRTSATMPRRPGSCVAPRSEARSGISVIQGEEFEVQRQVEGPHRRTGQDWAPARGSTPTRPDASTGLRSWAWAAVEAVKHSGVDFAKEDPERCGVVVGSGVGGIITIEEGVLVMRDKGPHRLSPMTVPKLMVNACTGKRPIMFGLRGPPSARHRLRLLRARDLPTPSSTSAPARPTS